MSGILFLVHHDIPRAEMAIANLMWLGWDGSALHDSEDSHGIKAHKMMKSIRVPRNWLNHNLCHSHFAKRLHLSICITVDRLLIVEMLRCWVVVREELETGAGLFVRAQSTFFFSRIFSSLWLIYKVVGKEHRSDRLSDAEESLRCVVCSLIVRNQWKRKHISSNYVVVDILKLSLHWIRGACGESTIICNCN